MSADRATVEAVLRYRRRGATVRLAADLAGVHVATVCRWQARDPELRRDLIVAAAQGREERYPEKGPRPQVRWHRDCPLCKARVVVRTAGKVRFWRCGCWPHCP